MEWWFEMDLWPARWYCGEWSDALGWTSIICNSLIAFGYVTVACLIFYWRSVRYGKVTFTWGSAMAFFVACGASHAFWAISFWYPVYRIDVFILGPVQVVTVCMFIFGLFWYRRQWEMGEEMRDQGYVSMEEVTETVREFREHLATQSGGLKK